MLVKSFNKQVKNIIDMLAYPMYVVIKTQYFCPCLNVHKTPDPNCKKCLGTGKRIKIQKITGVIEPDDLTMRTFGDNEKISYTMYYFNAEKVSREAINVGNIIVRDNEVDTLQAVRPYRSDSNSPVYYYVKGTPKKDNLSIFLKNFYEIIGDAG